MRLIGQPASVPKDDPFGILSDSDRRAGALTRRGAALTQGDCEMAALFSVTSVAGAIGACTWATGSRGGPASWTARVGQMTGTPGVHMIMRWGRQLGIGPISAPIPERPRHHAR